MVVRTLMALVALTAASAASAQWMPGTEITGQRVEVETNGVRNTVFFLDRGIAQISSPSGMKVVNATWAVTGGKICLTTDSTYDCYPYRRPFTARVPVDLLSDCGIMSTWMPLTTYVAPFERG